MPGLLKEQIHEALEFLGPLMPIPPRVGIILGSGLGSIAQALDHPVVVPTQEIPHYPPSTVPGHAGQWLVGSLEGVPVVASKGRVHHYEGYTLQQVVFPVHLLASLGVQILIVTTSSGGLNPDFRAGDLMVITDQLNWTLKNPLVGAPQNQLGSRFPDLIHCYDPELIDLTEQTAVALGIPLRKGVFCWVTGPAYETAAEVRMLRRLGGDAVSMSTAPEVIAARQRHLRVLGISLITNPGTGLSSGKLTHEEVTGMALRTGEKFSTLLLGVVKRMAPLLREDRPDKTRTKEHL
jgi:purine-nucleoside phosphorylase